MANAFPTTAPASAKACFCKLTPYALRFIDLLNILGYHIKDERTLDLTSLADTAYADRQQRAEATRDELYDVLLDCLQMPAAKIDAPLRRMTLLIATLIREERASAFVRYGDLRDDLRRFLHVPGDGPIPERLREMLAAADKRIALMAKLSCYRTDGAVYAPMPELIAA